MSNMNLLKETEIILQRNGKSLEDVSWFGTRETVFDVDIKKLFSVEYSNRYGTAKVLKELVVVGENWWLERNDYDGIEYWEFRAMPDKPVAVTRTEIEITF